jgi:hypothetical protein
MAQPPSAPPPDSIVLDKFQGIKNVVSRTRLKPDELEIAKNVDVDDVFQVRSRRGYKRVASGDFHSLFTADDGRVYGVKNGTLGIIHPNYSFQPLKSGIGADPNQGRARVVYVQVGPQIYYSSDVDSGIVQTETDTVDPWGDAADYWYSPVVNPTTTLPNVAGRLLGKPPNATAMTYWKGRIWMAQGRTLWATELFMYKYVDKTRNYMLFEGDITALGYVTDGIYVGTTTGLWFLSGTLKEMSRISVMDSSVIPGSMIQVPTELANPQQVGLEAETQVKVSVLFMTTSGFCAGQESGQAYNLTETTFYFPTMYRAAALFRRQSGVNQYLVVTDNGGTPSSNARIGDYVDAELVSGEVARYHEDVVYFGDSLVADIV